MLKESKNNLQLCIPGTRGTTFRSKVSLQTQRTAFKNHNWSVISPLGGKFARLVQNTVFHDSMEAKWWQFSTTTSLKHCTAACAETNVWDKQSSVTDEKVSSLMSISAWPKQWNKKHVPHSRTFRNEWIQGWNYKYHKWVNNSQHVPPSVTQLWKKHFWKEVQFLKVWLFREKNLFYHFRYCKPTQCTHLAHTHTHTHTDIMKQLWAPGSHTGSWVKQMFFKLCATHARSESLQWHWLSPERLHMVLLSTSLQMPG
jgi:hypothetical protein